MNKRLAYLIIFILPFFLFLPEILTGESIFWGLPILQFYPWRVLAFDQVLQGQIPLWNPYNGFGTPLLANYQSALLYPGTWIIFVFYLVANLPGIVWGHLFVNLLHLSVAGVGIYKIGEERAYSIQASVIMAISYSLSGYFLARFGFFSMIWAAAWFPWVFLYTLKIYKKKSFSIETVKLTLVISLLLLTGHAQLSWYIVLYSAIYFIFQFRSPLKEWIRAVRQFAIASFIAVGVAATQLLPTAELLLHSQRSNQVNESISMTYSFWPWHFLNWINPHIFGHPITGNYWGYGAYWEDAVYIGLLPLLLGLATIILIIRKKHTRQWQNTELAFLWVICVISIVFSLGSNTVVFPWLYDHIPTFDMFNAPARYMIWLVFSISLLAGYSFDQWKKPEKRTLYWVRLGTAGGVAIGIGAFLMIVMGNAIKPTFISATFEISILITIIGILYLLNPVNPDEPGHNSKIEIWKWSAVALIILDLFYMNFRHTPVQSIKDINDFSQINGESSARIYLPESTDYTFRYDKTLNFDDFHNSITSKELAQSNLANVNIFHRTTSLNNFEPMRLASYDNFVSDLNEMSTEKQKEILVRFGINQYGTIGIENPSEISFENLKGDDLIQAYSNSIDVNSINSIQESLLELPCVYILETENGTSNHFETGCLRIPAKINDVSWQAGDISFKVDMPQSGWILLTETYDTGWKLSIDGNKDRLHLANGFIMAFQIDSGLHTVHLRYLPNSLIFGSLISLVSLILMCILVYRMRKTQH